MNALDLLMSGNEPLIHEIADDVGMLSAETFLTTFNNACLQIAGFEDVILTQSFVGRLAPITNMSMHEH